MDCKATFKVENVCENCKATRGPRIASVYLKQHFPPPRVFVVSCLCFWGSRGQLKVTVGQCHSFSHSLVLHRLPNTLLPPNCLS